MANDDAPRDTIDIITEAIEQSTAEPEETHVDAEPDPADSSPAAATGTEVSGTGDSATPEGTPEAKLAEPTEAELLAQELEELGIKAPKPGERENRIPHSRTVKIFGNAKKKWETTVLQPALKERDTKLAEASERLTRIDAVEHLISTDPDQYLKELAAVNPAYQKFLSPSTEKPEVETVPADDPRPAPDAKFPDGGVGYSEEGLQKLLDWTRRQAERAVEGRVSKELDKRLSPFERDREAQQFITRTGPIIRAQIATVAKRWGPLFDDPANQAEITKLMATDKSITLDGAAATVLIPKLQSDRNKIRAELLKEINTRPAAASHSTAVATGGKADASAPRSIEDVIIGEIDRSGIRG